LATLQLEGLILLQLRLALRLGAEPLRLALGLLGLGPLRGQPRLRVSKVLLLLLDFLLQLLRLLLLRQRLLLRVGGSLQACCA